MVGSRAGLAIAADPVTGESYGDFWEKLNGEWKLYQVSSDPSLDSHFSAVVHGYDKTSTTLTYVPESGYKGSDSFAYTIYDYFNFSDSATVSLNITTPPVADAGADSWSLPSEGLSEVPVNSLPISCLLYTSPSPRDRTRSRMPSSA